MKRPVVAAVLVMAMALVAGCIPQYEGNPTGLRVGFLGDSTMDLVREELPVLLNDRYRTSLEAFPGYTVAGLQDEATLYAVSKPDVMVIYRLTVALSTTGRRNSGGPRSRGPSLLGDQVSEAAHRRLERSRSRPGHRRAADPAEPPRQREGPGGDGPADR